MRVLAGTAFLVREQQMVCRNTVVFVLFAAVLPIAHAADGYPDRPIRLIIPQAPGSSNDIVSRIAAAKISELLGQQIVIDNRTGATGIIATELAARAAPNGYTLFSGSVVSHAQLPIIYKKLPYDPVTDFEPIALLYVADVILCVNPALPAKSVKEFISLAKSKPGQLNMASAGTGSVAHLAGLMLSKMTATSSAHIPYKGGAANIIAVAAGEAQWLISPISAVIGQVRAGRLRALASGGKRRSTFLPDLPTLQESDVSGYEFYSWGGFMAPAATPRFILQKLHAAMTRALAAPEVKEQFAAQGVEVPAGASREDFGRFIASEQQKMRDLAKAAGLKPE